MNHNQEKFIKAADTLSRYSQLYTKEKIWLEQKT